MGILPFLRIGMVCTLLGGCAVAGLGGESSPVATYNLNPPETRNAAVPRWPVQLAVQLPTSARALDTDRILVSVAGGRISYFADAAWSDRLPRLLQSRIAAALQDSGAFRAVLTGQDQADGDYTLATEIRNFQVEVDGGVSAAAITLVVKLVNEKRGNVLASKEFTARLPANKDDPDAGVAALQNGFNQVAVEMVRWAASFRAARNIAQADGGTTRAR